MKVLTREEILKNQNTGKYREVKKPWVYLENWGLKEENKDKSFKQLVEEVNFFNNNPTYEPSERDIRSDIINFYLEDTKEPRWLLNIVYNMAIDQGWRDAEDIMDTMDEFLPWLLKVNARSTGKDTNMVAPLWIDDTLNDW